MTDSKTDYDAMAALSEQQLKAIENRGNHTVKVYDAKGALVGVVPPAKYQIIVLDDHTRHVIDSMWLKALGQTPGKTSHETAQSPASIGGLLAEFVEKSEKVRKLKEALRSIADACECTCGECPCQRIADAALRV